MATIEVTVDMRKLCEARGPQVIGRQNAGKENKKSKTNQLFIGSASGPLPFASLADSLVKVLESPAPLHDRRAS